VNIRQFFGSFLMSHTGTDPGNIVKQEVKYEEKAKVGSFFAIVAGWIIRFSCMLAPFFCITWLLHPVSSFLACHIVGM
jgi:hypothetical protein